MDLTNIIFILLGIAVLAWLITLQIQFFQFNKAHKTLMSQTKKLNLEEAIQRYLQNVDHVEQELKETQHFAKHINKMAENSVQKIGLVRFNPFNDTGGDQSFALAMLDSFNNGIVLSSIHSRENTRIYSKPIMAGKSKYNLSDEEIEAVKRALSHK